MSFSAAFTVSSYADTVSCTPKHFMEVDSIRERMIAIACDWLIHCFVEAMRRHDPAKRR
ncbi:MULTISPECIES: hypothetical protein [unclassified Burkholderia]|uniref:hypothetical protein n=1 Tax=unclassified Burkholderia TaxID=2613784 RepID=UPI001FC82095|nr:MULTISPECIES: hypothetical protein [unclassified Burkholderia]